jgi:hypothetical protein
VALHSLYYFDMKQKYIDDCARLIERRVELLEEELIGSTACDRNKACDRAAIYEAKHLAKLVRALVDNPYRNHPYDVAAGRLGYRKFIE